MEIERIENNERRKSVDIKIKKREFSIIEYIMRNEGKVVKRKMMIEKVWD